MKVQKNTKIVKPEDVAEIIKGFMSIMDDIEKDKEHLWVLGLNTRNVVTFADLISIGTTSESLIHPRELFRRAIVNNATAIIMAHNHPSGDPKPSDEDVTVTAKMTSAGNILGIKVLDHVIVASDKHSSLKALGLI